MRAGEEAAGSGGGSGGGGWVVGGGGGVGCFGGWVKWEVVEPCYRDDFFFFLFFLDKIYMFVYVTVTGKVIEFWSQAQNPG